MNPERRRADRRSADPHRGTRPARATWRPLRLLRSCLLAAAVFVTTATSGALLAGTATADDHPGLDRSAAAAVVPARPALADGDPHRFAYSLVYSGSAALAVSVAGLIMVGRRRRGW